MGEIGRSICGRARKTGDFRLKNDWTTVEKRLQNDEKTGWIEKNSIFGKNFLKTAEKRLTKQKIFSMINRLFANAERAERI